MYKVHHVFLSTGEWAETTVDTYDEAVAWYACKRKARNAMLTVLTLYENEQLVKQETFGK